MSELKETPKADVLIRGPEPGDINFILSSFLKGLYYGDSHYSIVPKDIFMREYHKIIISLLTRPQTKVKLACLTDDPTFIIGYSVISSDDCLDWVFIRKDFRKKYGISRLLVPNTIKTVSHLTKLGLSYLKNHKELAYNPFL